MTQTENTSDKSSDQKSVPGVSIQAGWGRLLFAHTFPDPQSVADVLLQEKAEQRDIAFYVNDPHLILNCAPQHLFLDPSNTFRLNLEGYNTDEKENLFTIGPIQKKSDIDEINRIYHCIGTVPIDPDLIWNNKDNQQFQYIVARAHNTNNIVGVVMLVDHVYCFDDMFNSGSLWALAVDPQTKISSVGVALVHYVASILASRGRVILDLSVMHDNTVATSLYEKLGFKRVSVFAIKRRNQINVKLFTPQHPQTGFNSYAKIIINEAMRRGIAVEPVDITRGYFRLSLGNRRVLCRESLCDLTSALAMARCDDKELTQELFQKAELKVPSNITYTDDEAAIQFLEEYKSVVVKPTRGEQGDGVFVDVRQPDEMFAAIKAAKKLSDQVLIEQFVTGSDLRVIVINGEVVAAAVRKPAEIIGDGEHTIEELIQRVSRRRSAMTDGESKIPQDEQTTNCVANAGYKLEDVLEDGKDLQVRKTANLHTGGTIYDVTDRLSATLIAASVKAAAVLEIPVVGLDFIVPDVQGDDYVLIEANERPGLANHEPQPTAEKFIDLLFPYTTEISLEASPTV